MESMVSKTVRLREAIPDLSLQPGDMGVVCSVWFAPVIAYEVEFRGMLAEPTRALVLHNQIEAVDISRLTTSHQENVRH